MSMTFSGQVALVTGAAAGIGRATALAFAQQGLKVVLADIDEAGIRDGAEAIRAAGGEAIAVRCDVTRDEQVKALIEQTLAQYGRLDYAFNNAGIEIEQGRLAEGSEAEFDAIMGVNVKGVWLCMKHQLPVMLAQGGGAIVNTASVAAEDGQIGQAAYSASKGGVVGMTLPIARDLASENIRVNTILPGIFDTPLLAGAPQNVRDALGASVLNPKRLGVPDEYAHLALCMIENGYFNGEDVRLDGGIRMGPR